jgi:cytoskeleton protein RodZ
MDAAEKTVDVSPGCAISQVRQARNMTTAEVAQHLKFSVKQIEALEADDYGKLHGSTLVRGMIRSYAKLLQIDVAPLLAAHSRRQIPAEVTVDLRSKRIPFPDGVRRSTRTYALLSVVILITVAGIAYEWRMAPTEPAKPVFIAPVKLTGELGPGGSVDATAKPAMPVVASPLSPEGIPSGQPYTGLEPEVAVTSVRLAKTPPLGALRRIDLEFGKDSWVEIKQGDGRTLLSQLNAAGTKQTLEGKPPFSLVIGNAPTVRLRYNDESVDLRPHFKVDVARLTLE